MYLNLLKPEKVHGPPGAQPEISSKEAWKKHMYFFWTKTYLIWKAVGGGRYLLLRALTKKIYPVLFLKYLGSLAARRPNLRATYQFQSTTGTLYKC